MPKDTEKGKVCENELRIMNLKSMEERKLLKNS